MVQIQPPRPNVQATFGWLFCYQAPSPREQVLALEYDKGQRIFEDELIQDSSIDDINHDVLDRYKSLLGTESSDEQVLKSRRFMCDGKLTVAGALLFAQDPSVMMPQARVRVLRYDGVKMETGKRLNITKERTFCGPLPKVIQDAHLLISSMLREFQFLGPDGTFQTVPEYPEFAWFEGLVNAVTHRDYSFASGRVTTKELAEEIDEGSTLCSKVLRGLVKKSLLEWHGTSPNDPRQYYSLTE